MAADALELIFLHGAGERASAWDGVTGALPGTWRHRAVELADIGFGETGRFEIDTAAQAVLQYVDPTATTVLCGLSLGAMVATVATARAEPGSLAAIVLSGGQVKPPKWMMRLQDFIATRLPESAFTGYGSTKSETLAMYEAVEAADLRGRLREISIPCAVWCGTRDIANTAAARQLAAGIDEAELRFVPGMGHDWHRSHPRAFAAHLREFLNAALPQASRP
jgi:3-oxoadipate enol-lactonase